MKSPGTQADQQHVDCLFEIVIEVTGRRGARGDFEWDGERFAGDDERFAVCM